MPSSTWDAFGNSYLVYEGEPLAPERVRALVGDTDGILEVLEAGTDSARITIWNPDGSTAELSGNGTRIAATWLAERTGAREVSILVGARTMVARFLDDGSVEQDMGAVEVFEPEDVAGYDVTRVSVGNPHAVVAGDPASIVEIGPLLETHPHFPNRTNVQVARVEAPGVVTARVWERGVGETSASGTSAVAVAAATHGHGTVEVRFPGGDLRVRLADGRAFLTGPPARKHD
jgi:diaminopimelate epimerase